MKRTTIFVDEQLERELQALARRQRRPMAAIVREAIEQYVVSARPAPGRPAPAFVALGRSGRRDTAERHEELLWEESFPGRRAQRAPRRAAAEGRPMGRGRNAGGGRRG